MLERLRWGILGTGDIARTFASELPSSETGSLWAVGSRTGDAAQAFADQYSVPRAYGSYEELLLDPAVDAVYIATPHTHHAEWAIRAAQAGKHVLCEKPMAMTTQEVEATIEAAHDNGVFLMEAFMYRCHPQTRRFVELIADGTIGRVALIEASFSFHSNVSRGGRLYSRQLGGGAILDVGCYCTSMARLVAGTALGQRFAEPIGLVGFGHVGDESGVDEWAAATLRFEGDMVAQLFTGIRLAHDNCVRVYGTSGSIVLQNPWMPGKWAESSIVIRPLGGPETVELIRESRPLYALEADTVAAHLASGQAAPPAMSWADSLGNMRVLEQWLGAVGMYH